MHSLAIVTSTMHYYVCAILLSILANTKYFSLTCFEIGIMFTGHTSGVLLTYKFITSAIKYYGLNSVVNIGFFILVISNFALWLVVAYIENSSVFATAVFAVRLFGGMGSGLIDASCLISRNH